MKEFKQICNFQDIYNKQTNIYRLRINKRNLFFISDFFSSK